MSEQHNILWLKCKASAGQFQKELAISGLDRSDNGFSLFVDSDNVRGSGENAHLRVVGLASEGELVLVRLPGRTFENGQTITVRSSQLEEEPVLHEQC